MNKQEIISGLRECIYLDKYGQCKASVATVKALINKISGSHIYCKIETGKSRLTK